MPLNMATRNQEVVINDILAQGELRQKLLDMGFTKGAKISVIQGGSAGSIMVKIRDSKIVLNASTAQKIRVA